MEKIKLIIETIVGERVFKFFIIVGILSLAICNIFLINKIIFLIINKYPISILAMIIIISLFILFRYSHYKSNINVQEDLYRYNQPYKLYSNKFKGIYFLLADYNSSYSKRDKKVNTFQIINNNEDLSIVNAKGKITLFSNGTETRFAKCFEKNFEISNLKSNTELQVLTIPINLEAYSLIRFEVELNNLFLSDDSCYNNIALNSHLYIRNTARILDHIELYDHKLLSIKTNYNLKWLKQKIRLLKIYIHYRCSTNIFLGLNPTEEWIKAARKDFFTKWLYRLLFGAIFLVSLTLIICSFVQLVQLTFLFLQWFGKYFASLIQ
ncbi:MAG TPA: hypothetical protein DCZ10_19380 [Pelotomaculum sp.]|nr:hypothetical protein [Pelotomaculum sp.]